MKDLSTDNLLTIAEIAEDCNLVEIITEFKNTKEKDPEKVGMQVFVKVLSGISKGAKRKFYEVMAELTEKDVETVKNQSIKTTFDEIKAIFQGSNAELLKDFFS